MVRIAHFIIREVAAWTRRRDSSRELVQSANGQAKSQADNWAGFTRIIVFQSQAVCRTGPAECAGQRQSGLDRRFWVGLIAPNPGCGRREPGTFRLALVKAAVLSEVGVGSRGVRSELGWDG